MENLAKCLDDAAALMERPDISLAKGTYEDDKRYVGERPIKLVPFAFCIIGALREVCPEPGFGKSGRSGVDAQVTNLLGFRDIEEVFRWNDRKTRKKEDVVARLRLGAEKARAGVASSQPSGSSG